ncbi:MAG: queuosine precursor transporter [Pelolinea sp.]|nr:queuosine precursor transporter [Pelolinea sp.]
MQTIKTAPLAQPKKAYRFLDLVLALFVTVLITSNIASSAKIVDWGFSIFGVRMAFDAGTLLFPISYIFGDVLTEVYGFRNARRVIWTGFGALALCALTLGVVRALPGETNWLSYAGNSAFDSILGGMSSFGIVAASLAAYFLGSYSNSVIMAAMKVLSKGKWLWMRTIGSTIVGEGVDTIIFVLIATLAGVFPWEAFASLTVTNYLFKVSVEALFTPVTYQIVNFLKKEENEDYFDIGTRFTPV